VLRVENEQEQLVPKSVVPSAAWQLVYQVPCIWKSSKPRELTSTNTFLCLLPDCRSFRDRKYLKRHSYRELLRLLMFCCVSAYSTKGNIQTGN
jgi:hypothetical protein